jgi:hypothetical protein
VLFGSALNKDTDVDKLQTHSSGEAGTHLSVMARLRDLALAGTVPQAWIDFHKNLRFSVSLNRRPVSFKVQPLSLTDIMGFLLRTRIPS